VSEPRLSLRFALAAYLECLEPVRLPQHRWSLHLTLAGQRLEGFCSIRGPQSYAGVSQSHIPLYDSIGSIQYVEGSGLHVNASDSIVVDGDAMWIDHERMLTAGAKRARRVDLSLRLPVALSSREAALDVALKRGAMSDPELSRHPIGDGFIEADWRVGEFLIGRPQMSSYTPERTRKAPS
jgi:hypothetical protein